MTITINNTEITNYTTLSITTRYNALVSDFSLTVDFDYENPEHKALFKPLAYNNITISDGGQRIFTGKILAHSFRDSANPELLTLSGYSLTGVLGDCTIPPNAFLQFQNNTLKSIIEQLIKPFGLGLVVDAIVSDLANTKYEITEPSETETVQDYLDRLTTQRNILLTHDAYGNVLLTKVKVGSEIITSTQTVYRKPTPLTPEISGAPQYASQQIVTTENRYQPIFYFNEDVSGVAYSFSANGQNMHSQISVQMQQSLSDNSSGSSSITNPYVSVYRPLTKKLTSGKQSDAVYSTRNILGREIGNIKLSIDLSSWELNGNIVTTNKIVLVKRPSMYLYNPTQFFIESINYKYNNTGKTATLNCVLPDTYTKEDAKNVFG